LVQHLKKGALVQVIGKVRRRSYDDKDGTRRHVTEIHVQGRDVLLLNTTGNGKATKNVAEPTVEEPVDMSEEDDGVPF